MCGCERASCSPLSHAHMCCQLNHLEHPGYQRWKGTLPAATPGMCFFLRQDSEAPNVTQIVAIAPGPEDKRKLPMGEELAR